MIIYHVGFLHLGPQYNFTTRRETVKYFLAPKEDGSDEVVEKSVSYDQKMYWLKGKARKDGFFTITYPKSGKTLTGFSHIEGIHLLTTYLGYVHVISY